MLVSTIQHSGLAVDICVCVYIYIYIYIPTCSYTHTIYTHIHVSPPSWVSLPTYPLSYHREKYSYFHCVLLTFHFSLSPPHLYLSVIMFQLKVADMLPFWANQLALSPVQALSHVQLFVTPWIAARQASLSITNPQSLLKLMSMESVMLSNHLILCLPLLLLPPIPPSIRVFSNESTLRMRWPKYWSFNFSISPSNEHPGLISFRMDWLDLLAVQRTLKNILKHHSSKASILQHSAFFTIQLSCTYMTTGKTIALTRWTFVGKVMSLLFNMLSRLVITFLPRSKHLLISWLQCHLQWFWSSPK